MESASVQQTEKCIQQLTVDSKLHCTITRVQEIEKCTLQLPVYDNRKVYCSITIGLNLSFKTRR